MAFFDELDKNTYVPPTQEEIDRTQFLDTVSALVSDVKYQCLEEAKKGNRTLDAYWRNVNQDYWGDPNVLIQQAIDGQRNHSGRPCPKNLEEWATKILGVRLDKDYAKQVADQAEAELKKENFPAGCVKPWPVKVSLPSRYYFGGYQPGAFKEVGIWYVFKVTVKW